MKLHQLRDIIDSYSNSKAEVFICTHIAGDEHYVQKIGGVSSIINDKGELEGYIIIPQELMKEAKIETE